MTNPTESTPKEFSRSRLLLGDEAMRKLQNSFVAVFGMGGVGSYAVEALARGGVGNLALFDDDKICITNINRQIIATRETVGKPKVEVMRERVLKINPKCNVEIFECFYTPENADMFDFSKYTYIIDAIDTVSAKLELAVRADKNHVPIISCMGAGNKLDPTKFEVADIYKTSVCPLARVMRRELRARGIKKLKVVYSKETPITPLEDSECCDNCVSPPYAERKFIARRAVPGSVSFVPPVAGLIIAGEVIKDITGKGR